MYQINCKHPDHFAKSYKRELPAVRVFDHWSPKEVMSLVKDIVKKNTSKSGYKTGDADRDDIVQTCLMRLCRRHYPIERFLSSSSTRWKR